MQPPSSSTSRGDAKGSPNVGINGQSFALPLTLLAIFTAIAIPWYWQFLGEATALRSVVGLPLWVVLTVGGSFAVSCVTFWLYQIPWEAEAAESAVSESKPTRPAGPARNTQGPVASNEPGEERGDD